MEIQFPKQCTSRPRYHENWTKCPNVVSRARTRLRLLIILGSLSSRVFETRTATGSELFSLLTCLHTTTFTLLSIFSPLEMISIKIQETSLPWYAKCSLPVAVRVSRTRVLKLPNECYPHTGMYSIVSQEPLPRARRLRHETNFLQQIYPFTFTFHTFSSCREHELEFTLYGKPPKQTSVVRNWITLSTGFSTIQRIITRKTNLIIQWIAISILRTTGAGRLSGIRGTGTHHETQETSV